MTLDTLYLLVLGASLLRLFGHLKPELLANFASDHRATFKDLLDTVVWAGVVAILLLGFFLRSFYIPSRSMEPSLQVGDHILVNLALYQFVWPARGDVVVFDPPVGTSTAGIPMVKRVMALEHDLVEVKKGQFFLNGSAVQDIFKLEDMEASFGPERVKKAHVFVLGDNRNDSQDSRYIGQIPLKNLIGRAEFRFYPPSRMGFVNSPSKS